MKLKSHVLQILLYLSCASNATTLHGDMVSRSNINDQLPLIQQQLQTSLVQQIAQRQQANVPLTQTQSRTIKNAYENAFNPSTLKTKLLVKIEQVVSTDEADAILRFLKSPLGVKITQADKVSYTDEFNKLVMTQGEQLSRQLSNDVNRYAIVKDIEKYSDGANAMVDTTLMVQFLIAQNDWYYSPPSPRKPSLPELMRLVGQQKQQMLIPIKQMTHVMLSQVYKNLSDAELETYIAFLKSPGGQAYYGKMGQALKTVLFEATQRTGELLKQAQ